MRVTKDGGETSVNKNSSPGFLIITDATVCATFRHQMEDNQQLPHERVVA